MIISSRGGITNVKLERVPFCIQILLERGSVVRQIRCFVQGIAAFCDEEDLIPLHRFIRL
jgi:hypothetical protein